MSRNAEYWRGRFSILEDSAFQQSERTIQNVEKMYMEAQRSIQKEIEAWYGRFAANNEISLSDARRLLNSDQLEEFRWNVDRYIKAGRNAGVDPVWVKKLENASAKVHISRLEALQMQIQQQVELLNGNQVDAIDALLKRVVGGNYSHTAYEIQKGLGIGWDLTAIDPRKLEMMISKPWTTDGRTFRDRCWYNKTALVDSINKNMIQGIMRGDSPEKAIQAIQKQFGVSRYKAARLIHTETSYFNAQSTKEAYKDLSVEKIEILETLDSRTCELCGAMDGKVIPISQYEPGITVPPYHPNCRGTTCPHFDDMDGERAARNADGEVYYVPSNMTYKDWKSAFMGGGSKDGLTVADHGAILKGKMELEQMKLDGFPDYLTDKKERKNTQALIDYVNGLDGADPNVVALYNRMRNLESIESNGIPVKVSHAKGHAVTYHYRRSNGKLLDVTLTIPKLSGDDLTGQVVTTLHEEMHLMDMFCRTDPSKAEGWFSSSTVLRDFFTKTDTSIMKEIDDLFEAFDKEADRIRTTLVHDRDDALQKISEQYWKKTISFKEYKAQRTAVIKEAEFQIDYQCRNAMGGGITSFEDIYDALSGGTAREAGLVRYGHGVKYYQDISKRAEETLANYGALSITRPDLVELLRKDKPELVKTLDGLVQEMLKKAGE